MPKYQTIFIDSIGELARLYFAKEIGKSASDMDAIRQVFHYPGATERLNIFFRRLQDLRDAGVNIVLSGHEQIDRIYAKGSAIGKKGEGVPEPIAIKGLPDIPGNTAPEELLRKVDCTLRMRLVNGKPMWVTKPEPLGGSAVAAFWNAGCRFNVLAMNAAGVMPPSYEEWVKLGKDHPEAKFRPPYIWLIYGVPKIGKTRLIGGTFPKPMRLYDLDRGAHVLGNKEEIKEQGIDLVTYNSENAGDYVDFISDFSACF